MSGQEAWWEPLPWDYRQKVGEFLRPGARVLDLSPEEGAFPFSSREGVSATCWPGEGVPFADESFDLVICRGRPVDPSEAARVLRQGGFYVTQQTGGMDAWEQGAADYNLENEGPRLQAAGFRLMWQHQAYPLGPGGRRGHRFIMIGKKR